MTRAEILALAGRVDACTSEDNALDVLCEVALFKPDAFWRAVRANWAGTKVIYTDHAGNQVTGWAPPWSTYGCTSERLRAVAEGMNDEG